MTLQSSGAISISQIKTELNSSSNSLRDLSAAAGKSTPDSMSEFYGYSATPVSYTYSIVAYNGYTTVQGTYTTKTGTPNTTFSFYNNSGSGGVVGSVCAQSGTVNVTSGNGTKTQGSTC
jgi:hypothetical protein